MKPGNNKFLLTTVALFTVLTGCSTTDIYELDLMPAPEVYAELHLDPFSGDSAKDPSPFEGIFYATDRMPVAEKSDERFYENRRGHLLRLGIGSVQLEQGQLSWEEAKEISLSEKRDASYSLNVTGIKEFGVLNSSRSELFDSHELSALKSADRTFANAINKKLKSSKTRDIYIFVHGYRMVFANPLLVATEFWHYLGYDGAFIAYSWASTPNHLAYAKDLETAAYSSRNLRLLIEYLSKQTNASRIHIIAHSAGTRVVVDALGQLALLNKKKEKIFRIENVMLIGSDFDRDIFSGYIEDGLLNVPKTLTLYMSETDKALRLSSFVFTRRRLGQTISVSELSAEARTFLQRTPELVVIDVTNAENADAKKGHDYFLRSSWVSTDVLMVLKYNLAPINRGIVKNENLPVWVFPDNYVDRLRQRLKKLRVSS